jgi:sugar phosphate isomerase/epimerase
LLNPPTRRDVLRAGAGLIAGAALGSLVKAEPAKKIPIGLELYTLRVQLPKDFANTIEAVGKMGYQGVEFAGYHGWDRKPKELRKLLDDSGLRCCGTHTGYDTLIGDNLKRTIELHQILGNTFLICPSIQANSAEAWLDYAKKFNEIADRAGESGMFVGYHSHASDFKKFNGKTTWEIFFDNTKHEVIHQIDVGNTLDGGGDPLALIKKYPGRTRTTHLKEHGGGRDTPIGEGKVDFKALFEAYESVGGVEWYVVEHETSRDPMKVSKQCLDNLHAMGK